jgi:type II secretory pathway component GspD/PulD (secretin)
MKAKTLLSIMLLVLATTAFAAIKDISPTEWTALLGEIGVTPEPSYLEKLSRSSETLDKINQQTNGSLKSHEWVKIFKQLSLEPKPDMQLQEWELLFQKTGIAIKAEVPQDSPPPPAPTSAEDVSTVVPATVQVTQETSPDAHPVIPAQPEPPSSQAPAPQVPELPKTREPDRSSKISLDLRGMDILSVLKMISQKSDLNIIAGNNVKGTVTIYLKDVDALDALKMILEMNDLAYVYEDTVIKVMPAPDYERIYGKRYYDRTTVEIVSLRYGKVDTVAKTLLSVKSKIGQIIPDGASNALIIIDTPDNIAGLKRIIETLDVKLETRVFQLSYGNVKEIADKIKGLGSPNVGNLQADERSNQLIVTDTVKSLEDIARLVESLDKRHREVLIESRILQVMHSNAVETGINWESVFSKINNQAMPGNVVANLGNLTNPTNIAVGGETGVQLSVGTLATNNFKAIIDLLQTVGKTNIVASPRIAAIENKEAKILVGTKEAYITTQITNSGTTTTSPIVAESVNFVDVGMKLYVTSNIGSDNFITMKIRPEISSVDRFLKTSQNNQIPIVRTSESETTVMVKDGITVVIAGLMEEKEIKTIDGVPLLSRIPIIGIPFRRTSTQKVKTELVVFLTPKIISGDTPSEAAKRN